MIRFSLFFRIIFITVLVITFSLIIIIVHCSIVRCSHILVPIHVESIFFLAVAIRSKTGVTCHEFIMLPIIGTNNGILRYVGD